MDLSKEIVALNLSGKIEKGLLKLVEAMEAIDGGGGNAPSAKTVTLPKGTLTEANLGKWVMNKQGVATITAIEGGQAGVNGVYIVSFGKVLDLPQGGEFIIEFTGQPNLGGVMTFGGLTVTWGTNVAIGATVEDTRNNLVSWLELNLVPTFVGSVGSITSMLVDETNEGVSIILDGQAKNTAIQSDWLNFITNTEENIVIVTGQTYKPNILNYYTNAVIVVGTNQNGYYTVNFSDLMDLNGASYNSVLLFGTNYPLLEVDWANCLNEYLNGAGQFSDLTITVDTNDVTISDINLDNLSVQDGGQGGDYGTDQLNINNTVEGVNSTPDIIIYPVIGRLSSIDGGEAIIDVSDINELVLPNNHNFVAVDINNLGTSYNDYYLVWDNGEVVRFLDIMGANQGDESILTILLGTYALKVLEEGLLGETVVCDKFQFVPLFN